MRNSEILMRQEELLDMIEDLANMVEEEQYSQEPLMSKEIC